MNDEQQENNTEGYEDLGTVPEKAEVTSTPPPTLLMNDGNAHGSTPSPQDRQDRLPAVAAAG
ncbi:hypothetical protein [Streptomyces sp. NBC_00878]|uniref:hypothetical protein n=1 Tax=Streptomyces sp. NBC_00878 TaxID=2975854 RepID=UPI00225226A0|nr:hypothetical protein [Streptomyces sp. NBC_00878]MCX4908408.1 hypothetical protein [Streptomyces sp. NBC_00878]